MSQMLTLMLALLTVEQIDTNPAAAVVQFTDGRTGRLAHDQKDYDYFLRLAYKSMERQHPIGVSLDSHGQIKEIVRADNDFASACAESGPDRVQVTFQGHDGTYYLQKTNPRFQAIIQILRQSYETNTRIWFVAHKPTLVVLDAAISKQ